MKKIIALLLVIALTAALSVSLTMAYLQDTDDDVNVMTLGNVYIDQIEQQWNADKTELVDFDQGKPLYPYVGTLGWADTPATTAINPAPNNAAYRRFTMENVVDKYVSVKNVGDSAAYVRTIFAFEMGGFETIDEFKYKVVGYSSNAENGAEFPGLDWLWGTEFVAQIDGKNYMVREAVHVDPLASGATTIPSLLQVYMNKDCGNAEVEKIDGNGNGLYDILVLSQAVQTEGFDGAKAALDTAFGAPEAVNGEGIVNAAAWFKGMKADVFAWQDVNYITVGDSATVTSAGGDTVYRGILSDGRSGVTSVTVSEGITRLNDRALCKAPTITSVKLPSTLTYIDESVFQQSGITSIEIPENVTYIGKQAMGACDSLETIVIRAKNVTIANYVARACANLKEVYIYSDSVTFESGSMYFTNKENADASGITFYVPNQAMADALYKALSTSQSYGLLIKSLDGSTTYYNTLKP